jgi:L-threonylcarbamoyladenylate synthase
MLTQRHHIDFESGPRSLKPLHVASAANRTRKRADWQVGICSLSNAKTQESVKLTPSVSRVILRRWRERCRLFGEWCTSPSTHETMKTEVIQADSEAARHRAARVLKDGGLAAFPTDTVYGVAALPWDENAVAQLYIAKQRPRSMPIPLLLSDAEQLPKVATLTPEMEPLTTHFWPGGLTLVLPKTQSVLDVVSPGPTVAVRVPDLELTRALIREAGGVLAVTSANISGQPSPVTAKAVEEQLGGRISLIVDGGSCPAGIPSSLLDCTVFPPALLRRGAVPEAALREIIGSIKTT